MKTLKKLALALVMMMTAVMANAQTMHLVMVAATKDKALGTSVTNDMNIATEKFQDIAKALGINFNLVKVIDNDFNKTNVENAARNLAPAASDVVIFAYCGHGFRFSDDTDEYPRMQLFYKGTVQGDDYLSLTEINDILVGKSARLTMMLSDCCNTDINMTRAEIEGSQNFTRDLEGIDIAKLRSLFLEQEGNIRITSAKPGQPALCTKDGGFLMPAFFQNIINVVKEGSKEKATWNNIIEKTSADVNKQTQGKTDDLGQPLDPMVMVRTIKLNGQESASSASADSANEEGGMGALPFIIIGAVVVIAGVAFAMKKKKN